MIKINCKGCNNHCCGQNPHLTPVLVPSEEKMLKKYARFIQTLHREIFVLDKKENGNCILLNDKTKKCSDYQNRPLECILYPFLLDFNNNLPRVKIDKRYCPNLDTLAFSGPLIYDVLGKFNFPKNWVKAYESLENY